MSFLINPYRWHDPDTVLLLPMTGADQSTTFTDIARGGNAPHTVTAVGDAKIVTAQADPFGVSGGVGYFDGNGDYLSVPDSDDWTPGAVYTIEGWLRPDVSPDNTVFITHRADASNRWVWFCEGATTYFQNRNANDLVVNLSWSVTYVAETWHHIALVKDGNDYELFLDGVSKGTNTSAGAINNHAGVLIFGQSGDGGYELDGFFADACITLRAKYTANFTPPARLKA